MDIVFGTKWFEKHQQKLLWLLNTPIIKYWFRWVMTIRSFDCRKDVTIIKISPNSFSAVNRFLEDGTPEITTDFSCHDRYSKRLYHAFKPFWYLFHMIDWVAFDRYEKLTKLSFGFSTLTKYPLASTSLNGACKEETLTNYTWAQIRDGAGNGATTNPGTTLTPIGIFSDNLSGRWNSIYRGFVLFDTSALTADATISATVLSLYGTDKADTFSPAIAPDIQIYTSTPASNTVLANGDYTQIGTTAQCDSAISYASYNSGGAYNDFTFNATGRGNVSKTGISKFGIRNANYDVANTAPTWSASQLTYMSCRSSDDLGASPAPRLVVTYTVPVGPNNLKSYNTNLKANIKSINTNPIANVKSLNTNV